MIDNYDEQYLTIEDFIKWVKDNNISEDYVIRFDGFCGRCYKPDDEMELGPKVDHKHKEISING